MAGDTRLRMSTDARREQLLVAGVELLQRRPHAEVSIEEIAAAAEVSNGLLYHYFPTKKDFILAALERGQAQLAELLAPDPELSAEERLDAGLDAYLTYVEEHASAFATIFTGAVADPDYAAVLSTSRARQMQILLGEIEAWQGATAEATPSPELRTAVQGWFFFVEGVLGRWLEHRDLERSQVRVLLKSALGGAIAAAAAASGARSERSAH